MRPPPVAVPSIVCTVTTTSLASVEPLCTDTVTDLETVLSVSVKVYAVASNPIVTEMEEKSNAQCVAISYCVLFYI